MLLEHQQGLLQYLYVNLLAKINFVYADILHHSLTLRCVTNFTEKVEMIAQKSTLIFQFMTFQALLISLNYY